MLDLNKYVVNAAPGNPLHSSGFASVANSGHVGSSGSDSFADRQKIEHGRQAVQSYNRSTLIGQTYNVKRANTVTNVSSGNATNSADPRLRNVAVPLPNKTFQAPPPRSSYNPYA